MQFSNIDFAVFIGYILIMIGLGIFISLRSKNETSSDYFLAGKALPWWAIGGSLIASNISAEQFIGMSGSGFKIGLAIASYEFMAAATLILVAWFMLPVFLKKGIYTMPQFVEQRFDKNVRTGLAVLWLFLFTFVNITSVLYLGALTLEATLGIPIALGVIGLALYSASFSIFGGLRTVVWTDIIQVVVLVVGGFFTTYLALNAFSGGEGFFAGLSKLYATAEDKFNMVLFKGEVLYKTDDGTMKDAWIDLPGLSVLLGGMWIANFYYWGMNQYIIQRALAAKSIEEARKGVAFAAFIKILLPLIVVIPGIVAYAMHAPVEKGDKVYAWVLNEFIPLGFKGICFAAVIAAVGSSISSMVNSVSTIFTLDIYQAFIKKSATEKQLVKTGRIVAAIALMIGVLIAPAFGQLDQAFQFIQKYTGYFSPGILVVFLFGMFWKRASANAALWVILASFPFSLLLDLIFRDEQIPFLNKMGISFVAMSLIMVVISLISNKGKDDEKAIELNPDWFQTSSMFKFIAIAVFAILAAIYGLLW
jgi:solute:Na+ symporter, SSS family